MSQINIKKRSRNDKGIQFLLHWTVIVYFSTFRYEIAMSEAERHNLNFYIIAVGPSQARGPGF